MPNDLLEAIGNCVKANFDDSKWCLVKEYFDKKDGKRVTLEDEKSIGKLLQYAFYYQKPQTSYQNSYHSNQFNQFNQNSMNNSCDYYSDLSEDDDEDLLGFGKYHYQDRSNKAEIIKTILQGVNKLLTSVSPRRPKHYDTYYKYKIFEAIYRGRYDVVKELLAKKASLIDEKIWDDKKGKTAIEFAVRRWIQRTAYRDELRCSNVTKFKHYVVFNKQCQNHPILLGNGSGLKNNKPIDYWLVVKKMIDKVQDKGKYKNLTGKLLYYAVNFKENLSTINTILEWKPAIWGSKSTGTNAYYLAIYNDSSREVREALRKYNPDLFYKRVWKNEKANWGFYFKKKWRKKGFQIFHDNTNLLAYIRPGKIPKWITRSKFNTLTLGDMHGNTLKLVHILTMYGVWNLSANDYYELVDIYQGLELIESSPTNCWQQLNHDCFSKRVLGQSPEKINDFSKIINRQRPIEGNNIKLIRFLGDLVGDRGKNDYLTLVILKWLKTQGIDYEIMLSNHGLNLLVFYLGEFKNGYCKGLYSAAPLDSLDGLEAYYKKKKKSINFEELISDYFVKHLKLFAVDIFPPHEPGEKKDVVIYTHAPAAFNVIEMTAKMYLENKFPKNGLTIKNIQSVASDTNSKFQEGILNDKLVKNVLTQSSDSLASGGKYRLKEKFKNPLTAITWAKKLNNACFTSNKKASDNLKCNLYFVHGHLGKVESITSPSTNTNTEYLNLDDNELGKYDKKTENNTGKLQVCLSGEFK